MEVDIYWRQLDIFDPTKKNPQITIVGVGSLGSMIAYNLAKMGFKNICVYDTDIVEEHNVSNQLYGKCDIGKKKVKALQERIQNDCGTNITIKEELFTTNSAFIPGIVYMAVDNMDTRKELWYNNIKHNPNVKLYIESRLGAELARMYTIDPFNMSHIREYEKTLYSNKDSEESPCTYRAIFTVICVIAGLAAHKAVKYTKDLPFKNVTEIKEGGNNEAVSIMCINPILVTSSDFK